MSEESIKMIHDVTNHLQFLGYEVEKHSETTIIAFHSQRPNLTIAFFSDGMLIGSHLGCSDYARKYPNELHKFVNKSNIEANLARCYVDEHFEFHLRSLFLGSYDKRNFGIFLDYYTDDFNSVLRLPETDKLLE